LSKKIAQVIVDIPSQNVDHPFEYLVPSNIESRVDIGSSVLISFGSRLQLGYVIGFCNKSTIASLNPIIDVIDEKPIFNEEMISLCCWVKERYLSTLSESLKLAFPPGRSRHLKQELTLQGGNDDKLLSERQKELLNVIANMGGKAKIDEIKKYFSKGVPNLIGSLERKGFIKKKYVISKPQINAKTEEYASLNLSIEDTANIVTSLIKKAPKQRKILSLLLEERTVPVHELLSSTGSSRQSLKSLINKGIVKLNEKSIFREPDFFYPEKIPSSLKLTDEQRRALEQIKMAIDKETYGVQLLQGVTGSGKTEIYLRAIADVLNKNKTAIVLVPEIALTPQTVHRFRSRFDEMVAVLHSGLSLGERYDQWERIKQGDCKVVVGTRSALFAPLNNLGLIVIDEEHETTYKQNVNPRYHAREAAKKRAQLNNALVILGSATPSIESKYEVEKENYELIKLTKRVENRKFPDIEIIDMRKETKKGNRGIFSSVLLQEMERCINSNKKIMLFLNRRGYAGFTLCKDCGFVFKCKRCNVSLVYHLNNGVMRCHHCGYTTYLPKLCPNCKSCRMGYFGIGTQRVESEIKRIYPEVPLIRMDADTTTKGGSHRKKIIAFKKLDVGILLGTQMIAKGLDFPDVALIGVINADTALNLPDFRAGERTFQLLMQISGRAGRGDFPGKVIIQSYCPDTYAISEVKKGTYDNFFEQEIKIRKELNYPPFSQLINILFSGSEEKTVVEVAHSFSEHFNKIKGKTWLDSCLGPAPAPLSKIKNRYRWHLILKTNDSTSAVKFLRENMKSLISKKSSKDVKILIDVEPIWTL